MGYECAYCAKQITPQDAYVELRQESWSRTLDKHQFCCMEHLVRWLPDNNIPRNVVIEKRDPEFWKEGPRGAVSQEACVG